MSQTILRESQVRLLKKLTLDVPERFQTIIDSNMRSFVIIIGIRNERVQVSFCCGSMSLWMKYKSHIYSFDPTTLTIEQTRALISKKCIDLIYHYRKRNKIVVYNDELMCIERADFLRHLALLKETWRREGSNITEPEPTWESN